MTATEQLTFTLMETLKDKGIKIATAESCTGGLISKTITDYSGSSSVFERGFVTYCNEAKTELLDVDEALFTTVGAVSHEVAKQMAAGALRNSHAKIAVSCTGIAGPGGATDEKPVGLVYIGIAYEDKLESFEHHFEGDRKNVRLQTLNAAIKHATDQLKA